MQEKLFKREKKIRKFTVKRNLLYQYVYFPLLFALIAIAPLGFYAFKNIFIPAYLRNNLANTIMFNCAAAALSFLTGLILAKRVRIVDEEKAKCNRLVTLAAPAINTAAIFIAYIAGGISAAKVAVFIVNPLFILTNAMFNFILDNSVVTIMLLATLSYSISFLIFTRKKFNRENKRQAQIFKSVTAGVTALALFCCTFAAYPEIEYEILKNKYEHLPFTQELDYSFYSNLPFNEGNSLVKADISIDFDDVYTAPRLDGATAFYPVYAAIAENSYSGLETAVKENEWTYYSDWDDNIFLYDSNYLEVKDGELFDRCAELIRCTQTTNAYNALADGNSDVVFAFEPSDAQIAYAAQMGVEFELTHIGYDAFCFFVNKKNPVDNLTLQQLQDIYSGKITNWRKVGGDNKRIFAFTRPKNSGSQTIMESLVLKDVAISTKFEAKVVKTMGRIINVVDGYLNTPAAIGYTFMYYSSFMVTGESIKYVAIDGVAPAKESVKSGAYIFSTPFYAVTIKNRHTPQVIELLDWLESNQGQNFIESCGYVGI